MKEKTLQRLLQFLIVAGMTISLKFCTELTYGILYNSKIVIIMAVVLLVINFHGWAVVYSYYRQLGAGTMLSTSNVKD